MKRQQVNKLYNKLTPHEQAALVFEAIIKKNEKEADLISDLVMMRTYSIPDLDYQQRLQGFTNLSSVYGMFFWKALFVLSTLTTRAHFSKNNLPETIKQHIKKFNSIDVALTAICERLNIDVSTIKQLAECNDFDPDLGDEVDNQFVEQYKELFAKVAHVD